MKNSIKLYALILIVLFLAGCGSKEESSNTAVSDDLVQTDGNTLNQDSSIKSIEQKSNLKEILSQKISKYTAEYEYSSQGLAKTHLTMIYDLPRFATKTITPEGESKSIYDGKDFIICNKVNEESQCFKMSFDEPINNQVEDGIKSEKYTFTLIGSCSFAGETGNKYEIIMADGSKAEFCYTYDGIMLSTKMEGTEMTAVKILRSVSESDFIPSAVPQDLSSLYSQGLQSNIN